MAYKLVKYGGRYVLKTSPGKKTWTGEKQVYRLRGPDGSFARDVIGVRDEPVPQPAAEALLHPVMRNGRRLEQSAPLSVVRERCASQLAALPASVRRLRQPTTYQVEFSERLTALQRAAEEELEVRQRA
jgi:nicotinate phosphoribosyltransferase